MKSQLGIDTVDIQSGGGDLSRSMVTVGKYLTPQLYLSYGYSALTAEQLLKIRYRISKSWEVETWRGNEMGSICTTALIFIREKKRIFRSCGRGS